MPHNGEMARTVVYLDLAFAAPLPWHPATNEYVNTGSAWRHLGVAVELIDDVLRPPFDYFCVRVAAFVEVDATELIIQ